MSCHSERERGTWAAGGAGTSVSRAARPRAPAPCDTLTVVGHSVGHRRPRRSAPAGRRRPTESHTKICALRSAKSPGDVLVFLVALALSLPLAAQEQPQMRAGETITVERIL